MKKFFALLLALGIALCASAQTRRLTVNVERVSLKEFLAQVESQTGFTFAYNNSDVDLSASVTVKSSSEDIVSVVNRALGPQGLVSQVEGSRVVLSKAPVTPPQAPVSNRKIYSGVVSGDDGELLIGAAVMVGGSASNATVTGVDGSYSISAEPGNTVVVSYLGYLDKTVTLGDNTNVDIVLNLNVNLLEDVVVVGYGVASKKLVSSSIATMKPDEIDKGAEVDPVKMLQGRVTGVSVVTPSGSPGASPSILVRGVSSVNSSSPLYVVDGIPAESYPALNSNDIESMEVLKDASATAIYGSRANAGVVIITTKSGKNGTAHVDFNTQVGLGQIAHDVPMANTEEYIRVMQQAVDNYNVQMLSAKEFYIPKELADYDWVGAISRNLPVSSSSGISVSGGTDKLNFYLSGGVDTQEGYIKTTSYYKYTGRAKFSYKPYKWIKLNLNTSIAYSRRNMAEETDNHTKLLRTAREEQPWYEPYKADGSYNIQVKDGLTRHNPLNLMNEETWKLDKFQIQGTFSLDINPVKGLHYTPSISGYGILDYETKKLTELNEYSRNADYHALEQQKDNSFRYVFDNVLSYDNDWKALTYSAMIGHSIEKYQYDQFGFASSNYNNEAYPSSSLNLVTSGSEIFKNSVNFSSYALESYFARVALNYGDRYIVNGSFRADGSSRFPRDNRFGFFPAGSVAWIISNEKFMPKGTALSELKLRLSAGQTGSMAGIGNWAALSLISAGKSYNGSSAFTVDTPAQNIKWEKSTKYDAGLDLGFWDDRMTASFDYYYSRTDDMLYSKPVLASTGMTSLTSNIGVADNQGFEFSIGGRIIDREFKWDMNANVSWQSNRLVSLLDGTDEIVVKTSDSHLYGGTMHILKNGAPISSWYMLRFDGLYQYDEDVPEKLYAKGVRAGDCRYYDANGDGDIDERDRVVCGKATPDVFGGLTSVMRWKGLELSVFCSYSIGNKLMAVWKGTDGHEGAEHLGLGSTTVVTPGAIGDKTQFYNVSKDAATGYWDGPGTSNTIPRPILSGVHVGYDTYDYNVTTSTRYLEDASYFKIKTLTLAYNLPEKWMDAIKSRGIKAYFTVDNLACFTKYDGFDPEATYSTNPGNCYYGVDFGLSPTLRSFIFGLQFKF